MQPDPDQLNQLIRQIVAAVHPLRILLFGSAARGEMNHRSDVDLLVVVPDGTHRRRTARYLYRTVEGVRMPFDLIVATPSDLEKHRDNPGLVYRDVLREGKTIYAA